jgi:glutamyl/glutaminyl-tRNA synthetase
VLARVRFAPSPTGSLHLGNALVAAANRAFADSHGGVLVLRIDDTDATRVVAGGEEAILADLTWLGIAFEEGPVRQSERGALYAEAADRALHGGAVRDADGSVRLGGTTLVRPDGTATYQLASVVDDLELGITHVIRGADHRSNEAIHRAIAEALGGTFPQVTHVGLLLGEDGKKLSKRHGPVSVADLREEGVPAAAARAYLDELGIPAHDVLLDRARIARLATDAIAAMDDAELAAAVGVPVTAVGLLRGARTLVEAAEAARLVLEPALVALNPEARPTIERFLELRANAADVLDADAARAILRELKAVGGDLRAVRRALTGAERGPELWAVLAALAKEETIARAVRAAAL